MRDRTPRGPAADVVVILGALLALGVAGALLWWAVVDLPVYVKARGGGARMSEVDLMRRFDVDGWYAVIAGVSGFLAGLGLTWWRARDFRLTTLLLVVGAALAGATMASLGRLLGPDDPERALATAPVGAEAPVQLLVTGDSTYLVWPVAVLFGALMVLWSSPRVGQRELAEDIALDPTVLTYRDDRFAERAQG